MFGSVTRLEYKSLRMCGDLYRKSKISISTPMIPSSLQDFLGNKWKNPGQNPFIVFYPFLSQFQFLCSWFPMFFPIGKSKIGIFKEHNPMLQFLMVKSLIAGRGWTNPSYEHLVVHHVFPYVPIHNSVFDAHIII